MDPLSLFGMDIPSDTNNIDAWRRFYASCPLMLPFFAADAVFGMWLNMVLPK